MDLKQCLFPIPGLALWSERRISLPAIFYVFIILGNFFQLKEKCFEGDYVKFLSVRGGGGIFLPLIHVQYSEGRSIFFQALPAPYILEQLIFNVGLSNIVEPT